MKKQHDVFGLREIFSEIVSSRDPSTPKAVAGAYNLGVASVGAPLTSGSVFRPDRTV